MKDVTTNQLTEPRNSGQAGRSRRVEWRRIASGRPAPTGYKSPLAPWRRRHTSLALWTVRNSVARVPPVKSARPGIHRRPPTSPSPTRTLILPVSWIQTVPHVDSARVGDSVGAGSRRRDRSFRAPSDRLFFREERERERFCSSRASRSLGGQSRRVLHARGILPGKLSHGSSVRIQQMNNINLHSSCTMMLLGILASTIIGLTSSAPLSSYERTDVSDDRPKFFLLIDQRIPELEGEMLNLENDLGSDVMRTKRIGSLSIVNNLDVLRQRVLLELARRKALQDQRQVDENRRFLESIGKRSVSDAGRIVRSDVKNNRERSTASSRNEWIEDPLFRGSQDARTAQANDLRLL
ncbi:uncharacterized protein LOC105836878 [Monomorium pharaonis]|uniref:uncharacterized protein LOC105836878 n=1 Tax=Monomorium pharaonis TaxID=307658 RepID=UPI00102E2177|nr:uncharacterized protein LOC105836878 [Monomorium pharaonis]